MFISFWPRQNRLLCAMNSWARELKQSSVSITPLGEPVVPPVCTTTQACCGS